MSNDVMTLDICGRTTIENPTNEQICTELGNLSEDNGDSFAIISSSEMTYMQTAGDKVNGFCLEYQEGSVDAHFSAAHDVIRLDSIIQAFIDYRDGNPDWQSRFTFEKCTW